MGISALLNCDFTMRIAVADSRSLFRGFIEGLGQPFCFLGALGPDRRWPAVTLFTHLLARPSFGRFSRFSRLFYPFVVILLEAWAFICLHADQELFVDERLDLLDVISPLQTPEHAHSKAGQQKRPTVKQMKQGQTVISCGMKESKATRAVPNLAGLDHRRPHYLPFLGS